MREHTARLMRGGLVVAWDDDDDESAPVLYVYWMELAAQSSVPAPYTRTWVDRLCTSIADWW